MLYIFIYTYIKMEEGRYVEEDRVLFFFVWVILYSKK